MKKRLSLLATHLRIGIAKNKPNRSKEITLAGPIATDDDVQFRREWFDDRLVLIAKKGFHHTISASLKFQFLPGERSKCEPLEALDDYLLDVHLAETSRSVFAVILNRSNSHVMTMMVTSLLSTSERLLCSKIIKATVVSGNIYLHVMLQRAQLTDCILNGSEGCGRDLKCQSACPTEKTRLNSRRAIVGTKVHLRNALLAIFYDFTFTEAHKRAKTKGNEKKKNTLFSPQII